jgi:hypothetical protein
MKRRTVGSVDESVRWWSPSNVTLSAADLLESAYPLYNHTIVLVSLVIWWRAPRRVVGVQATLVICHGLLDKRKILSRERRFSLLDPRSSPNIRFR